MWRYVFYKPETKYRSTYNSKHVPMDTAGKGLVCTHLGDRFSMFIRGDGSGSQSVSMHSHIVPASNEADIRSASIVFTRET